MNETSFNYQEFTTRNIGFVTPEQQESIRNASVFVCGAGGMGGACVQSLVRAGIGNLAIADFDSFEISNMNRQVFAYTSTAGKGKVETTERFLRDINPQLNLEIYDDQWTAAIDKILSKYKIVVNGMDDIAGGILLYRKAREHQATIIDAYASPLPSVIVVKPHDPRPEQRLKFPTQDRDWQDIPQELRDQCLMNEVVYTLVHSSSIKHIVLDIAMEMVTGKRSRMSFAPMVITTGNMMAFEVMKLVLNYSGSADNRGYFYNPWRNKIENPKNPAIAWILDKLVRRYINKLMHAS